jgi:uncharacterized membrane protein YhaH (DUF805 family)
MLFCILAGAFTGFVSGIVGVIENSNAPVRTAKLLIFCFFLLPSLAVGVRRLHDVDKSGWWLGGFYILLFLFGVFGVLWIDADSIGGTFSITSDVFLIAAIITGVSFLLLCLYLLIMYCAPGDEDYNQFGPSPN